MVRVMLKTGKMCPVRVHLVCVGCSGWKAGCLSDSMMWFGRAALSSPVPGFTKSHKERQCRLLTTDNLIDTDDFFLQCFLRKTPSRVSGTCLFKICLPF